MKKSISYHKTEAERYQKYLETLGVTKDPILTYPQRSLDSSFGECQPENQTKQLYPYKMFITCGHIYKFSTRQRPQENRWRIWFLPTTDISRWSPKQQLETDDYLGSQCIHLFDEQTRSTTPSCERKQNKIKSHVREKFYLPLYPLLQRRREEKRKKSCGSAPLSHKKENQTTPNGPISHGNRFEWVKS